MALCHRKFVMKHIPNDIIALARLYSLQVASENQRILSLNPIEHEYHSIQGLSKR